MADNTMIPSSTTDEALQGSSTAAQSQHQAPQGSSTSDEAQNEALHGSSTTAAQDEALKGSSHTAQSQNQTPQGSPIQDEHLQASSTATMVDTMTPSTSDEALQASSSIAQAPQGSSPILPQAFLDSSVTLAQAFQDSPINTTLAHFLDSSPIAQAPQRLWKYPHDLFVSLMMGDFTSFCTNRLRHFPGPPDPDFQGLTAPDHVTSNGDMAVHLMVAQGRWHPAMNDLTPSTLDRQNEMGYSPLCLAAAIGNFSAVRNLLELHPLSREIVVTIDYPITRPPVAIIEAARRGHVAIVRCLLQGIVDNIELIKRAGPTGAPASRSLVRDFLEALIESDSYGVLIDLLQQKDFAWEKFEEKTVLWLIINSTSEQHKDAAQTVRFLCVDLLQRENNTTTIRTELVEPVLLAARKGLVKIIVEIIAHFPAAVWFVQDGRSLFHFAVLHRQHEVFNLIYQLSSYRHILLASTDNNKNNLLHIAGKLPDASMPEEIVDPSMKMQTELEWFKAVESILPAIFRTKKNADGKTPWTVFTEEHKGLAEEGEKWIREACQSSTVVAALITGVGLAASITVPGGYTAKGYPIHRNETDFARFYRINTSSMFSSLVAMVMFLSVLIVKTDQLSFLRRTPTLMILGYLALIGSSFCQAVAFFCGTSVVERRAGFPGLVICVVLTAIFQYVPLKHLWKILWRTYGWTKFRKQRANFIH